MRKLLTVLALIFTVSFANAQWAPNTTGVPYSLFAVDFYDANTGVAVGQGGTIVRTVNGGMNWTLVYQDIPGNYWLNDVKHTPYGFFAVGKGGIILRSIDLGATWTVSRHLSNDLHTFRGLDFNPFDGDVHVVGYAGSYFTFDGFFWTQRFDINKTMHSIAFAPDAAFNGRGIIVGTDGAAWRTVNGAVSWNMIPTHRYDYLNDVKFLDDDYAVVCGNNGTLLRSSNWGGTWYVVPAPGMAPGTHLRSIDAFEDPFNLGDPDFFKVTTCGDDGVIYTSNDGGDNYLVQASGTFNHLYGVSLKGFTDGVVVGEIGSSGTNGFVVMTSSNGAVGISQVGSEVPAQYTLSQNFPNPFNPSTKINFSIPKTGMVQLAVYDMTGKLVSNLVNNVLNVGTYSYEFNASNLSSGTYIYKIITNDFVQTKKMTLIK
ncbi:MAG TPA: YCF48-related protein [Ignavibacteria bacterium]|nr:YCF48-related protein [Ignavibacteria bacterium]